MCVLFQTTNREPGATLYYLTFPAPESADTKK